MRKHGTVKCYRYDKCRCASCTAAMSKQNQKQTGYRRGWNILKKYGITSAAWQAMLHAQDNKCACCGTADPGSEGWQTDHDHSNGKIRGIICRPCNLMLGFASDDPERLLAGVSYLNR